MKKIFSLFLVITLIAVLFWGCEKNGDAPSLPPVESMTIDFSNFTTSKKSAVFSDDSKNISAVINSNWTIAAATAGLWNILLSLNLAVPVYAFKHAVDNKPVFIENKTWQWSYSVTVVGATYKARLTGQIEATDIKWEMYISREGAGAFAEFLWFTGTTALDGKSGQWILNHSQQFQEPMLQVDWTVTGTVVGSIKYTYVRTLNDNRATEPFKNSYIEYGLTTSTFNAFYNLHFWESVTLNKFIDVKIEWSTTAHNGHIKSIDYFQDNNWHCWDGNGNNVTCN